MISRIELLFRRLRKFFSRSEWAVKLLGLSGAGEAAASPGVIMIQIDGLAHTQFRRAMKNGRMPFLKGLLDRQGYELKPLYSGVPSTTPAVQAELFYGKKGTVPAFSYVHRRSGRLFAMYDPRAVDQLVRSLAANGAPLLTGGVAYSDIYAGGADESRYCIETFDLKSFLRATHPLKSLIILLLHVETVFRALGLALIELGLAVWDFFNGLYKRKNVFKELKFIPTRVGVAILLRELIRFRVKMDAARGIPIVHANLLGYDEQSHRRGPDSAFAHWSLKGIDGAIGDICRAARRSGRRDYHIVVYSDHGQETAESYRQRYGRRVGDAVREVLAGGPASGFPMGASLPEEAHENLHRRGKSHLRKGTANGSFPPLIGDDDAQRIRVADMGPLGHIYLPSATTGREKTAIARRLADDARIPLILFRSGETVAAVNEKGFFDLCSDRERVLGRDHPFLDQAAQDLTAACRHPDAGDFVISGWSPERAPMTFAVENGAHGGPGTEETRGFLLLPPAMASEKPYWRPLDLRQGVQALLARPERPQRAHSTRNRQPVNGFRAMTYNIHSCISMDGRISPERIIRVIRQFDPDLIALQEVDAGKWRTRRQDQAALLAGALSMSYRFHPVVSDGDGDYGLALLSRFPLLETRGGRLPAIPEDGGREARGVLQAVAETPGGPVQILTTHLSLYPGERRAQMAAIVGPEWLGALDPKMPALVCGDFNAGPRSPAYRLICGHLTDVRDAGGPSGGTFFSRNPLFRIDHIFISPQLQVRAVRIPRTHEVQLASDHLPIYADLSFGESFFE